MNKVTLTMERSGQVLTIQTESPEVCIGEYNIRFTEGKPHITKAKQVKPSAPRKIGFRASSEIDDDEF